MVRIYPENTDENKCEIIIVEPKPIKISQISLGSIYDSNHHTFSVKFSFFYDKYKNIIKFLILSFIISIIILISILVSNNNKNKDNPCYSYNSEDYASSVSIDCFSYLWEKNCNNKIPSKFNGGWWLRSPKGNMLIPCYNNIEDKNQCGAGNYKNIITNIFRCNLYYEGI